MESGRLLRVEGSKIFHAMVNPSSKGRTKQLRFIDIRCAALAFKVIFVNLANTLNARSLRKPEIKPAA